MSNNNSDNQTNSNSSRNSKRNKLDSLQLKRLMRVEKENREFRKKLTTLLNYQREVANRTSDNNKILEANNKINSDIRANNKLVHKVLQENKKYIAGLKQAQAKGDAENIEFYKQCLKDNDIEIRRLKDLNKELKENRQDIIDSLDDINESISDMSGNLADNMREMVDSLNLSSIEDMMGEGIESYSENMRQIKNRLNFTRKEGAIFEKAILKQLKLSNKQTKNLLNAEDFANAIEMMQEQGVKDPQKLEEFAEFVAIAEKLGVDYNDLTELIRYSDKADMELFNKLYASTRDMDYVNENLTAQLFNDVANATSNMSQEQQELFYKQLNAHSATMQHLGVNDSFAGYSSDFLNDVMTYNPNDTKKYQDTYGSLGAAALQQAVVSYTNGDMEGVFSALNGTYLQALGNDGHIDTYEAELYGLSDDIVKSLNLNADKIMSDFATTYSSVNSDLDGEYQNFIENQNKTLKENLNNKFSHITASISSFFSELGIDWSDISTIVTLGSFAKGAFSTIAKLLNINLPSLGGLFGSGSALGGLGGTLKNIGSSLWNGLTSVGSWMWKGLGPVGSSLSKGLGSVRSSIGSSIGSLVTKLGSVGSSISSVLSSIGGSIAKFVFSWGGFAAAVAAIGWFGFKDAQKQHEAWEQMTPEEQDAKLTKAVTTYKDPLDSFNSDIFEQQEKKNQRKSKSQFKAYNKSNGSASFSNQDIGGMFRSGLDEVPYDGFKAVLHSGEKVLTKQEAKQYDQNKALLTSVSSTSNLEPPTEGQSQYDAIHQMRNHNAGQSKELLSKIASKENIQSALASREDQLTRLKSFAQAQTPSNDPTTMVTPSGPINETLMYSGTDGFFKALGPSAKEGYNQYGVFPATTLAQAALESGWGKSRVAKTDKNLFGIKYTGKFAPGLTVSKGLNCPSREQGGARPYNHYLSFGDSMTDHAWFLKNNSRYTKHGAFKATNAEEQVRAIAAAGYAEDGSYATSLINMIRKYNLNQYKQGTPYVPNDQLAVLHKGEMIVPKANNPMDGGKVLDGNDDLDTIIKLLKWGFDFLGKKLSEGKVIKESTKNSPLRSLKDVYQNVKLER